MLTDLFYQAIKRSPRFTSHLMKKPKDIPFTTLADNLMHLFVVFFIVEAPNEIRTFREQIVLYSHLLVS